MKINIVLLGLISSLAVTVKAEASRYSISGISSGGFMAVQMGTIFSSRFQGVGTVAGGFFYCAQNHLQDKIEEGNKSFFGTQNLFLFQPSGEKHLVAPARQNPNYMSVGVCMQNPTLATLPDLNQFYTENKIENPAHLSQQKIYLYHGLNDAVIAPAMKEKMKSFYLDNHVRADNLLEKTLPGGHTFPTDKKNLDSCFHQGVPYLASCDFNLAEKMLNHLLGKDLVVASARPTSLYVVDQNISPVNLKIPKNNWKAPADSLSSYGYLYASDKCLENPSRCELHVALHGCEMNDSFDPLFDQQYLKQVAKSRRVRVAKRTEIPWYRRWRTLAIEDRKNGMGALKFALKSGYIEMAEANDLMILFPQTQITEKNYPYNPKGCWDWFGWTGRNYATRDGIEAKWMVSYLDALKKEPRQYILSVAPELKSY